MEVEAALQPPSIRLNSNTRKYAIRVLKLAPNHPVKQELDKLAATYLVNQELTDPANPANEPAHRPTLQLERIRVSIQHLADTEYLEPLQHFKYPPWNRATPYTVNISPLPKEEAATAHNSNLLQHDRNDFLIYTDASSMPGEGSTGIGVGIVVEPKHVVMIRSYEVYCSLTNYGRTSCYI
jgi:hypothetical protein